MKTLLTTTLLSILFSFSISAQESTITVVGESKIEALPDRAMLSLSLSQQSETYQGAVDALNNRTKSLFNAMTSIGFKVDDIKTLGFNAQPHFEYLNGRRQQRGYNASQRLELIFDYDSERLIEVVNKVSKADAEPNLNISFLLSDKKRGSLKERLLKDAMAEAKTTASILASTQGKNLDGFVNIQYGAVQQPDYPMMKGEALRVQADAPEYGGFEAKEISLYEKVTVVWRVK